MLHLKKNRHTAKNNKTVDLKKWTDMTFGKISKESMALFTLRCNTKKIHIVLKGSEGDFSRPNLSVEFPKQS